MRNTVHAIALPHLYTRQAHGTEKTHRVIKSHFRRQLNAPALSYRYGYGRRRIVQLKLAAAVRLVK